jgi:flagellar protein FlgJ
MDGVAALAIQPMPLAQDPESLAQSLRSDQTRSVDSVAKNFEGLFMSLLLKEMRQTLESGSFFGSDSADVYGGLFDLYLGQHLAQGEGLGIASMLKQQLQTKPHEPASKETRHG